MRKLWQRFCIWRARVLYGVELVYVTPEEHARMVPSEARDAECLSCIANECTGRHYYGE